VTASWHVRRVVRRSVRSGGIVAWGRLALAGLLVTGVLACPQGWAADVRVTYTASDQDATLLISALGRLSGDGYQADTALLAAGIGSTVASLALREAGPAACRQALGCALDCWWADAGDGTIALQTGAQLPRMAVTVRTVSSTLLDQPLLPPLVDRLMTPWLGGEAGISYLPNDGRWTASLDERGHQQLVEILSLCERPSAQALSRVTDPDLPDPRRVITSEQTWRTWPALVDGLGTAILGSVALSPRLRLHPFPAQGVRVRQLPLGQLPEALRDQGVPARWSHGVLCLGPLAGAEATLEREHPAQRRKLALIPIGHLLSAAVDGELIVTALKRRVCPGWWQLPGAGLEFLSGTGALLVAGDADVQHAVLAALAAIDRLGLELGLRTLAAGPGP
jgi:hypothetical protein